jgi:hypothetical protein
MVMASENENLEIEFETPEVSTNEVEVSLDASNAAPAPDTSKEMDDYAARESKRVQERIGKLTREKNELKRATEAALAAKAEAEAYARQAFERAQQAEQTLEWGRNEYLLEINQKLDYQQKLADKLLKEAQDNGDTEAFIKAQNLRDEVILQKAKIANAPKPVPTDQFKFSQPQQMPEFTYQAPQINDLQEEIEPDIKVVEWQSRNPWFGKDTKLTALAFGIHQELVNEGFDTSSDSYYQALDHRLADFTGNRSPRKSSPVAPAGRTPASRKVTLNETDQRSIRQHGNAYGQDVFMKRLALEKKKLEANQ